MNYTLLVLTKTEHAGGKVRGAVFVTPIDPSRWARGRRWKKVWGEASRRGPGASVCVRVRVRRRVFGSGGRAVREALRASVLQAARRFGTGALEPALQDLLAAACRPGGGGACACACAFVCVRACVSVGGVRMGRWGGSAALRRSNRWARHPPLRPASPGPHPTGRPSPPPPG